MPGPVREVAVARGLLSWKDFVDPLDQGFENGDDGVDGFRLVARVGELVGVNRLTESDNEAEEIFFFNRFFFLLISKLKKYKKKKKGKR